MPTGTDENQNPPVAVFIGEGLTADYHDDSCPDLRKMVRSSVEEALQEDVGVAAALLRLFFHDCFPQGCDASILLVGTIYSEMEMAPNTLMRRSALQLIEDIRAKVHGACGATVSCADILALATHDAVVASGGKPYYVPLGRLDSLEPAPYESVIELPLPIFNLDRLIASFSSRSLDEKDQLVVLSGAHTIGRAHCSSFSHRYPNDEYQDFVYRMRVNCTMSGIRHQDLDVTTPDEFDNEFDENLVEGEGVLYSDMQLLASHRTRQLVNGFRGDEWWFWNQFGSSSTYSHW